MHLPHGLLGADVGIACAAARCDEAHSRLLEGHGEDAGAAGQAALEAAVDRGVGHRAVVVHLLRQLDRQGHGMAEARADGRRVELDGHEPQAAPLPLRERHGQAPRALRPTPSGQERHVSHRIDGEAGLRPVEADGERGHAVRLAVRGRDDPEASPRAIGHAQADAVRVELLGAGTRRSRVEEADLIAIVEQARAHVDMVGGSPVGEDKRHAADGHTRARGRQGSGPDGRRVLPADGLRVAGAVQHHGMESLAARGRAADDQRGDADVAAQPEADAALDAAWRAMLGHQEAVLPEPDRLGPMLDAEGEPRLADPGHSRHGGLELEAQRLVPHGRDLRVALGEGDAARPGDPHAVAHRSRGLVDAARRRAHRRAQGQVEAPRCRRRRGRQRVGRLGPRPLARHAAGQRRAVVPGLRLRDADQGDDLARPPDRLARAQEPDRAALVLDHRPPEDLVGRHLQARPDFPVGRGPLEVHGQVRDDLPGGALLPPSPAEQPGGHGPAQAGDEQTQQPEAFHRLSLLMVAGGPRPWRGRGGRGPPRCRRRRD